MRPHHPHGIPSLLSSSKPVMLIFGHCRDDQPNKVQQADRIHVQMVRLEWRDQAPGGKLQSLGKVEPRSAASGQSASSRVEAHNKLEEQRNGQ